MVRTHFTKHSPFSLTLADFPIQHCSIPTAYTAAGFSLAINISRKGGAVAVRLKSGIEGIFEKGYLTDTLDVEAEDLFPKGRMIPAVVFHVETVPETDSFLVRLSARQSEVSQGDSQYRRVRPDIC